MPPPETLGNISMLKNFKTYYELLYLRRFTYVSKIKIQLGYNKLPRVSSKCIY